jgi:hypothetical protein
MLGFTDSPQVGAGAIDDEASRCDADLGPGAWFGRKLKRYWQREIGEI